MPGLSSRPGRRRQPRPGHAWNGGARRPRARAGPAREDLVDLIIELTNQMHAAAELQFEFAARLRDEIKELKHELRGMQAAGV